MDQTLPPENVHLEVLAARPEVLVFLFRSDLSVSSPKLAVDLPSRTYEHQFLHQFLNHDIPSYNEEKLMPRVAPDASAVKRDGRW